MKIEIYDTLDATLYRLSALMILSREGKVANVTIREDDSSLGHIYTIRYIRKEAW